MLQEEKEGTGYEGQDGGNIFPCFIDNTSRDWDGGFLNMNKSYIYLKRSGKHVFSVADFGRDPAMFV